MLSSFIIKKRFHEFNAQKRPVMVYLHPRDIDPVTPRLPMPLKRSFKCYLNVKSTEKKLVRLLEDFSFTTLCDYFKKYFDFQKHQMHL